MAAAHPTAAVKAADGSFDFTNPSSVRGEIEAWSWESVGLLAVLGLLALTFWSLWRLVNHYVARSKG